MKKLNNFLSSALNQDLDSEFCLGSIIALCMNLHCQKLLWRLLIYILLLHRPFSPVLVFFRRRERTTATTKTTINAKIVATTTRTRAQMGNDLSDLKLSPEYHQQTREGRKEIFVFLHVCRWSPGADRETGRTMLLGLPSFLKLQKFFITTECIK